MTQSVKLDTFTSMELRFFIILSAFFTGFATLPPNASAALDPGASDPAALASPTLASRYFPSELTFSHELFETREECAAAQAVKPSLNCSQWIHFTADGKATVVVGDQMNLANYEIIGDRVVVTLRAPGDAPPRIELKLATNRRHLIEEGTDTVWESSQIAAAPRPSRCEDSKQPASAPVAPLPPASNPPALQFPSRRTTLPPGGVVV